MPRTGLSSIRMGGAVISALLIVLLVFAHYQVRSGDVRFPSLPDAPKVRDTTRPSDAPPPPPPQPTWEEFSAKVNTFRK